MRRRIVCKEGIESGGSSHIVSGTTSSATRTQKFSFKISTSPRAIKRPFTKISTGSPASLSSAYDRAFGKLQDFFQVHVRAAKLDPQIEFNIANQIERRTVCAAGAEAKSGSLNGFTPEGNSPPKAR